MDVEGAVLDHVDEMLLGFLVKEVVALSADQDIDAPKLQPVALGFAHLSQVILDRGFALDAGEQIEASRSSLAVLGRDCQSGN